MTLEFSILLGFILHFVGDYLLQNDYTAQEKVRNSGVALSHAAIYSFPFLLVCYSNWWWLILISHFFIDRYRLAVYYIKAVNWNWRSNNFGYSEEKPVWMSTWLLIVVDNTFHVMFNTLAIYLAFD